MQVESRQNPGEEANDGTVLVLGELSGNQRTELNEGGNHESS